MKTAISAVLLGVNAFSNSKKVIWKGRKLTFGLRLLCIKAVLCTFAYVISLNLHNVSVRKRMSGLLLPNRRLRLREVKVLA